MAPASRPGPSSTASRPTSSRWLSATTSTPSPRRDLIPRPGNRGSPSTAPVHLDHRLRRPQREPEGDPRLARPRPSRRRGHHAESEDVGGRALGLPRRLGVGARRCGKDARAVEFVSRCSGTSPPRHRSPRRHDDVRERGIGDVYLAWENEALLVTRRSAPGSVQIVIRPSRFSRSRRWRSSTPSSGSRGPASSPSAYVEFLYSPVGRRIEAKHGYRPRDSGATVGLPPYSRPSGSSRSRRFRRLGEGP